MNKTSREALERAGILKTSTEALNPLEVLDSDIGREVIDQAAAGRSVVAKIHKRLRKKRERRINGLLKEQRLPGAKDLVQAHPKRDEIDYQILHHARPLKELAEEYGLKPAILSRRRARLKLRLSEGKQTAANVERQKAARGFNKTMAMMHLPLDAAVEGNKLAMEMKQLGPANDFINTMLKTIQMYGQLTGELAPPGQMLVNQDNRQLTIMSLPRSDDPQDVIEASERLVLLPGSKFLGGGGGDAEV